MIGIMFHHFHGDAHRPTTGSVSAEELEQLIERHRPRPALEWLESPHGTVLTFDDGLRSQYDVALPVLEAHGLTALWFVPTGRPTLEVYRHHRETCYPHRDAFYVAFEERAREMCGTRALVNGAWGSYLAESSFYSDADRRHRYLRDVLLGDVLYGYVMDSLVTDEDRQADLWIARREVWRLVDCGHAVGLHTHTHPVSLHRLSRAEQREEWEMNRETLLGWGARPVTASYPFGRYTAETIDVLRRLGVEAAFRANTADVGGGLMELPRADCADLLRRE